MSVVSMATHHLLYHDIGFMQCLAEPGKLQCTHYIVPSSLHACYTVSTMLIQLSTIPAQHTTRQLLIPHNTTQLDAPSVSTAQQKHSTAQQQHCPIKYSALGELGAAQPQSQSQTDRS